MYSQYGFGRVLIEVNGVVFVDSSGEFASSAFADIDVGGVPETLAPTLAPTSPAPVTPIPTNPLPTMSPTPAPTPAQTFSGSPKPTASTGSPEDRFAVSLLVKHDEYPEETSWEILDSNGLVLVSQSFNSSVSSGELVSEELSLSEGSYTLSLKDSYGDGVCCTHGNGYVVVKVGSRTVVDSDGTYGGGKDFPFIVSDAPPQSSTTYELAFTADSYPFEVSFSLVGEGGVVVLDSNSLIFPDSGETAVYELTLTPGMSYTLTVNDSWGDGICCVHGDGQIEVYALLGDGTKETLVAPLGSFGESITSVFIVPNFPSGLSSSSFEVNLLQPYSGPSQNVFPSKQIHKPFDSRIINGSPVPNKDVYPWFVQGPDGSCGASLIGENLVLTAAHCAVVYPVGAVLHIGNIELDDPTAERRTISRTYMHEAYNDFTLENDVMVLLLDSPSSAPPVELNSDVLTEVGQVLTVMGFGVTETGMSSKVLREVDVNLVSDSRCNTNYGGDISASLMLCAAASDKDSCQGDSGGPLVDASGAQVGIVSFGIGCADPSYPGVYAEVAGLYDWIVRAGCLNLRGSASFCDSIDIPPTVAPTEYEGELFVVTISVTHDRYPRETSWDFLDPSGALVPGMSQAPGSVTVPSSTVTAEASVPPGLYRFRIFDTLEDGICW